MELRATHLKRLAFVIYSSEVDQYHRQLPDVQERIADCLRLYNSPVVLEQVKEYILWLQKLILFTIFLQLKFLKLSFS